MRSYMGVTQWFSWHVDSLRMRYILCRKRNQWSLTSRGSTCIHTRTHLNLGNKRWFELPLQVAVGCSVLVLCSCDDKKYITQWKCVENRRVERKHKRKLLDYIQMLARREISRFSLYNVCANLFMTNLVHKWVPSFGLEFKHPFWFAIE